MSQTPSSRGGCDRRTKKGRHFQICRIKFNTTSQYKQDILYKSHSSLYPLFLSIVLIRTWTKYSKSFKIFVGPRRWRWSISIDKPESIIPSPNQVSFEFNWQYYQLKIYSNQIYLLTVLMIKFWKDFREKRWTHFRSTATLFNLQVYLPYWI